MRLVHGFVHHHDAVAGLTAASQQSAELASALGLAEPRLTIAPAGPLSALCLDLAAVMATAPGGASALAEMLADADRAAVLAMAHNRVLCAVVAAVDVLPVRLGAVVSSGADGDRRLAEQAAGAVADFARLSGAAEYALRVIEPARKQPAAPPPKPSSGRDYLARRLAQRRGRSERADQADGFLTTLETAALSAARDHRRRPIAPASHGDRRLLDLALLVARDRVDDLSDALDRHAETAAALGLSIEAIGPWPAFHFIDAAPPKTEHGAAA